MCGTILKEIKHSEYLKKKGTVIKNCQTAYKLKF